jgi:tetratricopeptide repeat protein 21B
MTEILQTNRSYVPAIIAFSLAKLVQKKFADARSQLKTLSKMQYSAEYADYFEKGWLLLAEFYIDNNKLDLAIELLGKCIKHNQSCSKAEELLGHIKEKQQNPAEASGFYEAAWKKLQTGSIGYRLAFNYLSAAKYVQAIDICHQVLRNYPDYPQIKENILKKAREALRV